MSDLFAASSEVVVGILEGLNFNILQCIFAHNTGVWCRGFALQCFQLFSSIEAQLLSLTN